MTAKSDKIFLFVKVIIKTQDIELNDAVKEIENTAIVIKTENGASLTLSNSESVQLVSCELLKIYNKHDK